MRSAWAHRTRCGSNVSTDNLGEPHARVFRPTCAAVLKRGGRVESIGKRGEIRNQKIEIRKEFEGGKE